MIVEDDVIIAEELEYILTSAGYDLKGAFATGKGSLGLVSQ